MTSLHIRLEARSAEHHCFRAYEIDVEADLFWRMGGGNELRPARQRHNGTQQGAFLRDTRRRSGTSSCLPTKAIDRATSDWCRLPCAEGILRCENWCQVRISPVGSRVWFPEMSDQR